MKSFFHFIIIILFTEVSFVQAQCNDDIIMAINGKWKKSTGYNAEAAKSQPAILRINKMIQLLQAAYQPKGTEAAWSPNSGREESPVKNGPLTYNLTADFMEYFCFTYNNKTELKCRLKQVIGFLFGQIVLAGLQRKTGILR